MVIALVVTACGWPQDNRLDPRLCDPPCAAGQLCVAGACQAPEAGLEDVSPVDRGRVDEGAAPDVKLPDAPAPDSAGPDLLRPDTALPDLGDLGTDLCTPCTASPQCDDGHPCTVDYCGPGKCCLTAPALAGIACDDNKACTKYDACDGKGGCAGVSYTCTPGTCEATSACDGKGCKVTYKAKEAWCTDGNPYTKMDRCDGTGSCKPLAWSPSKTCPGMLTSTGWCWYYPLPQGNTLWGVWAASKTDVFAVGTDGTILRFDGSLWRRETSGATQHLKGVWGSGGGYVYAVGEGGTILRRGSQGWVAMASGTTASLHAVWGISMTDVVAVGAGGVIVRFNGKTWKPAVSGTTSTLNGIWGSGAGKLWAVGDKGTVLSFDGKTWKSLAVPTKNSLRGVWGNSATEVYAVGNPGTVLRFDGTTWKNVGPPTNAILYGIYGTGPKDLHVVGRIGSYSGYSAHFDGTAWKTGNLGKDNPLVAISGVGASDIHAVGSAGNIAHYDGVSWRAHWEGGKWHFWDVWGTSHSDVFVSGWTWEKPNEGVVLRYDGERFNNISPPGAGRLEGLWGAGPSSVFTIDNNGSVFRYDGKAWKKYPNLASSATAIWGFRATDVYAVGYDVVLRFDGSSWKVHTSFSGSGYWLKDIWGSSSSDLYVAGQHGFLRHFDGKQWTPCQTGFTGYYRSIWGAGPSDVCAVGGGKTYHFDGTKWSLQSSGGMYALWGTSSSNVYAGSGNDPYYWQYDGKSWKQKSYGTSVKSICCKSIMDDFWGTGETDIFAVGDWGRILHYKDP